MSNEHNPIARMIRVLDNMLDESRIDVEALQRLTDSIGRLTLRALRDDGHALAVKLQDLRQFIEEESEPANKHKAKRNGKKRAAADPVGNHVLFMPMPGNLLVARFWKLQLLLYVAGQSKSAQALADHLVLAPAEFDSANQEGPAHSVQHWSRLQFVQYLRRALNDLDVPEAPLELEKQTLRQGDIELSLTTKQAKFLAKLIEHRDDGIDAAQLQKLLHIKDPKSLKYRLLKLVHEAGIELDIYVTNDRYQLVTAIERVFPIHGRS